MITQTGENVRIFLKDRSGKSVELTVSDIRALCGYTGRYIFGIFARCLYNRDLDLLFKFFFRESKIIMRLPVSDYMHIFDRYMIRIIKLIPVTVIIESQKERYTLDALELPSLLACIYQTVIVNQYNVSDNLYQKNVIDAGAYMGIFSIYALMRGAKKVYAFEPLLENFKILKKNIYLNNLSNKIIAINKGLSNHVGKTSIYYIKSGDSGASLRSNMHGRKIIKKRVTSITSIDVYIKTLGVEGVVDFIKIDSEGSERQILYGAKAIIREYTPVLSFSAYHFPNDKTMLPAVVKGIHKEYNIRLLNRAEETFYCSI